jgi:hypothetical protein|tara:strand:+ start:654 stop:848 length:195 start_codon:yes stop_codon:yes gene_type:complete
MNIWNEVIQEFEKEQIKLKDTLATGGVEDFPHYKQIVGSIQGIEWCQQNLKSIIKKRTYEEDEE